VSVSVSAASGVTNDMQQCKRHATVHVLMKHHSIA
jgi:hypothetical protein